MTIVLLFGAAAAGGGLLATVHALLLWRAVGRTLRTATPWPALLGFPIRVAIPAGGLLALSAAGPPAALGAAAGFGAALYYIRCRASRATSEVRP